METLLATLVFIPLSILIVDASFSAPIYPTTGLGKIERLSKHNTAYDRKHKQKSIQDEDFTGQCRHSNPLRAGASLIREREYTLKIFPGSRKLAILHRHQHRESSTAIPRSNRYFMVRSVHILLSMPKQPLFRALSIQLLMVHNVSSRWYRNSI